MSPKGIGNLLKNTDSLTGSAHNSTPGAADGHRELPTTSKDAEFDCRIHTGRYDSATDEPKFILQITRKQTYERTGRGKTRLMTS